MIDRSCRPRACCREAENMADVPMPPGGMGVIKTSCEQCHAPAEDGMIVIDGVRRCGRRHYYARMVPGTQGIVPQPLIVK